MKRLVLIGIVMAGVLEAWPASLAARQQASRAILPPPSTTPSQAPHQYTGRPISIDVQGADLRAVLRSFTDVSGLNMVIDSAVTGKVDLKLTDVPWDQALEIILQSNKLGYSIDGSVVRIAPLATLTDEQDQRKKLAEAQALAGAIEVRTFTLSYAKATTLGPLLKKVALSARGDVQMDEDTNTLIVSDLDGPLTVAEKLIADLDRAQPQVEIDAKIVQTNRNDEETLGLQWGGTGQMTPAIGNTTNLAFPNSITATGTTPAPSTNLTLNGTPATVGLSLGAINGALGLNVTLSALEKAGRVHIISEPHVTTQNNHQAEVTQGFEIPFQTTSNNTVTVQFRDAALKLTVTPQITSQGTVIMDVALENGQPDFSRAVNGNPSINTQRAATKVQVSDGATTVIGGIVVTNQSTTSDHTPGLSRLPLLGWLFRSHDNTNTNDELLIFITPRILRTAP